LSKTLRKRITKFGTLDAGIKKYIISAPPYWATWEKL
jgi:hypothetical protein